MLSEDKASWIFFKREHNIAITIIERDNFKTVFTSLKIRDTTDFKIREKEIFPYPFFI